MAKQPVPPNRLTRERILQAALVIAAREGIGQLSMRRLAQELDVWPMTIYGYFADKDALLDAMAASAIGEVARPSRRGSWRTQIRRLLEDVHRAMADSPGLSPRLPRAFLTPEALELTDAGVAILAEAGFDSDEAASCWRALWSYTFGFATSRVEAAGAEDAEFEYGLDRLLDGLEARLAKAGSRAGGAPSG
jgi:AcrR family transcriptional regulator